MQKKSDHMIDSENWLRLNCYLQAPGENFKEKLANARMLSTFVLGSKPAEVVEFSPPAEPPAFSVKFD